MNRRLRQPRRTSRIHARRIGVECLEDRRLLALNNVAFANVPGLAQAVQDALNNLGSAGADIASRGEFSADLPVLGQSLNDIVRLDSDVAKSASTLGDLPRLGGVVSAYLATPNPTGFGLAAAIRQQWVDLGYAGDGDVAGRTVVVEAGLLPPLNAFRINLEFATTRETTEFHPALSPEAEAPRIELASKATAALNAQAQIKATVFFLGLFPSYSIEAAAARRPSPPTGTSRSTSGSWGRPPSTPTCSWTPPRSSLRIRSPSSATPRERWRPRRRSSATPCRSERPSAT